MIRGTAGDPIISLFPGNVLSILAQKSENDSIVPAPPSVSAPDTAFDFRSAVPRSCFLIFPGTDFHRSRSDSLGTSCRHCILPRSEERR